MKQKPSGENRLTDTNGINFFIYHCPLGKSLFNLTHN
jgi:hypothetical protein